MDELFSLFDEIGLPYFRQGSMSDKDYKPSFFTYWNIDTPTDSYYDNKSRRYNEYIQVGHYTNDASKIYSVLDDFIKRAEAKGFVVEGKPKDANSGRDDYFGRICYIRIIHKGE
jgi:hypothetical protein